MINGGEDIGAVVADLGSVTTKFGYAGEDYPRAYFASNVGMLQNEGDTPNTCENKENSSLNHYIDALWTRTDLELKWPIGPKGEVNDWDAIESIIMFSSKKLNTQLSETPILLAEKSNAGAHNRHKYAEMLFENFSVPALFLGRDAVLSCFATGKTTGTCVDVGGQATVTPVVDGWINQHGVETSFIGGTFLQKYFKLLLEAKKLSLKPTQAFKKDSKPGFFTDETTWAHSYKEFLELEVVRDILAFTGRVSDMAVDESAPQFTSVPGIPYELPDGTEVIVGLERFKGPELYFNTDPLKNSGKDSPLKSLLREYGAEGEGPLTLVQHVMNSIQNSDRESQNSLANSIVLCGGGSTFHGMHERIKSEVEFAYSVNSPALKVKVLAAGPNERAVATWLGGSILASLGSFHEMWMGKGEYEEHGARLVDKKFP
mmetsp:Transcript_14252/g.21095  ORF Transcript_14252/g.21095 Transcript_14252/m.21095 type:complete len:430 (-) Transcript_14252:30-1319(-)|eukprot:CAMPEP_0171456452 /NCGR_PEP_ID=MMETSP0945-20130129/2929_1 /TAXON_ID=109269 /ORGANISM="Vaucheria litorea, Strain CCMP2940" /LENGTH=429 /DNA_ID=CAMNT_0011981871 /DNA_START=159 /DNA_END=1448 /DNA_ORIENTATION=+